MGLEILVTKAQPLTLKEMIELLPESRTMGTDLANRMRLEVAIKTVQAIEAGTRLGWLVAIMTFVTLAITVAPYAVAVARRIFCL